MKYFISVLAISLAGTISSCQQTTRKSLVQSDRETTKVGGGCDGCNIIFSQSPAFDQLDWVDTLPDFNECGQKMVISGIIYQADGINPASNVILYVYHTDQTGHYSPGENQTGPAKRHGRIRGWMKTNERGEYKFYTLKPVAYPSRHIPAHIHPVIKELFFNEYYIDEYLFDDDPLLTASERKKQEGRGGNGIVVLKEKGGMIYGERNIYLGRNIPDYPQQ
jgi:protocatechuate 3,4-dioxygenase beta subunit